MEEEELADELDLFAVSEAEDVFNDSFLVRHRRLAIGRDMLVC